MAKEQPRQNPVLKYLWDSDPQKMGKVLGKELVAQSDVIPPEVFLDDKEMEISLYQHQDEPSWLRTLFVEWSKRVKTKQELKTKIETFKHFEFSVKVLKVYNEWLDEDIKAETKLKTRNLAVEDATLTLEVGIEEKRRRLRDLKKEPEKPVPPPPPPPPPPPKSKLEEMKEQIQFEFWIRTLRAKSTAEFLVEKKNLQKYFEEQFPDDPEGVKDLMDDLERAIIEEG